MYVQSVISALAAITVATSLIRAGIYFRCNPKLFDGDPACDRYEFEVLTNDVHFLLAAIEMTKHKP